MTLPAPAAVPPIVLSDRRRCQRRRCWPARVAGRRRCRYSCPRRGCPSRQCRSPTPAVGVARDDVPRRGRRAADRVARRAVVDLDAVAPLPTAAVPVAFGADEVARDQLPVVPAPVISTPSPVLPEITLPAPGRRVAADRVVRGAVVWTRTPASVADRERAGDVGADQVPFDQVARGAGAVRYRRRLALPEMTLPPPVVPPRHRCCPDAEVASRSPLRCRCPARRSRRRRCRSSCPGRRWSTPMPRSSTPSPCCPR